jgi:hypothetical protein
MPRTADPSHEAVRDDKLRACLLVGMTANKWLARVRVSPSKTRAGAGVYVFHCRTQTHHRTASACNLNPIALQTFMIVTKLGLPVGESAL